MKGFYKIIKKKNRILASILSLLSLLSVVFSVNITAAASDRSDEFAYDEKEDGTIEINKYIGNKSDVTIPAKIDGKDVSEVFQYTFLFVGDKIKSINADKNSKYFSSSDGVLFNKDKTELVFYPMSREGEYVMPDGVRKICGFAFAHCRGLESITIPDTVTFIDGLSFCDCPKLKSITIPKSVTYISYKSAFLDSENFESIAVSEENTVYSSIDGVLYNKDKTELLYVPYAKRGDVHIPSGVKKLPDYPFQDAENIENVYIPESLTEIDTEITFELCSSLKNIYVDEKNSAYSSIDGVLFDKDKVNLFFYPRGRLGAYTVPDGVCFISSSAFSGHKKITEITLSDGIDTLNMSTFSWCKNLEHVNLPDSITYIGNFAFAGCEKLNSFTIPPKVTEIKNSVFSDCKSLKKLFIHSKIEKIDSNAFDGCESLEAFDVSEDNSFFLSDSGVLYDKNKTTLIVMPRAKSGELILPDSLESFYDDFSGCRNLTSVYIPNLAYCLSALMFRGCDSLENIIVSDEHEGYTSVDGVLYSKDMSEIIVYPGGKKGGFIIPETVTSMYGNVGQVFYDCRNLTSIYIPSGISDVSEETFFLCDSLAEISVSENNPNYSAEDGVLYNKDKTALIRVPNGKTGDFTLKESVASAGKNSFLSSKLSSVTVLSDTIDCSGSELGYYYDVKNQTTHPTEGFVIKGHAGSEIQKYAERFDLTFVDMDKKPDETTTNPDTEPTTEPIDKPTEPISGGDSVLKFKNSENGFIDEKNKRIVVIPNSPNAITAEELKSMLDGDISLTDENNAIFTSMTVKFGENEYTVIIKGDTNSDGRMSAADARNILRIAARLETPSDNVRESADIDSDGSITSREARSVLRFAARLQNKIKE